MVIMKVRFIGGLITPSLKKMFIYVYNAGAIMKIYNSNKAQPFPNGRHRLFHRAVNVLTIITFFINVFFFVPLY